MLLLVEHDHVMRTPRARHLLGDLLTALTPRQRRVVVFRSTRRRGADLLGSYPQNLRERIVITPPTPRGRDLAFWLRYEVCCTLAALRNAGVLGRTERWVVIASPDWTEALSCHFHPDHLLPVTGELNEDQIPRLRSRLGRRATPSVGSAVARISLSDADSTTLRQRRSGRGAKAVRLYRRGTRPNMNAT